MLTVGGNEMSLESTRRIVWNALHEIEDDTVRQAALDAFQAVVSRLAYLEKKHEHETERGIQARVSVPDEISFCDGAGHSVKVGV